MVNPVKEWERKATDRKNKINSLQKTQKTADLYRKRLAKLNTQASPVHKRRRPLPWANTSPVSSDRVVCPRRHFRDGRSNHAPLLKTGRSQSATPSTAKVQKKVTDLIYLLQNDPHIHRVENISLSPVSGSTDVRVNFQFLSLVIGTQYGKFTGTNAPRFSRRSKVRIEVFMMDHQRALFLPYQKQPPPPLPPPSKPKSKPPSSPPPPGPETYKIVSLSEWQGEQEVMVLDTNKK